MLNDDRGNDMRDNAVVEKSFAFAIRIVNLAKYLRSRKKEFILSKQILRSGTSIGANIAEAQRGQSSADFAAKMTIALKEANETEYWIKLLYSTAYINNKEYFSLKKDIDEILSLLTAICKTVTGA